MPEFELISLVFPRAIIMKEPSNPSCTNGLAPLENEEEENDEDEDDDDEEDVEEDEVDDDEVDDDVDDARLRCVVGECE